MKLIARPHATPKPQEPTVELKIFDEGGRIIVSTNDHRIAKITHDGELFVIEPCNDARVAGEPSRVSSSFIEAVRPLMEAIEKRCGDPYFLNYVFHVGAVTFSPDELSKFIAAWKALTTGAPAAPKSIPVKMTDTPPDRPGWWLRSTSPGDSGIRHVTLKALKGSELYADGSPLWTFRGGKWSESPLEISE